MMELCNNAKERILLERAYLSLTQCAQRINNSKRLTEMDLKTRELHELILTIRESDHLGKLVREVINILLTIMHFDYNTGSVLSGHLDCVSLV